MTLDLPWGQLLVNGLALGSLYALTAFGIVLLFKTTRSSSHLRSRSS